jgi:hypothetical protein
MDTILTRALEIIIVLDICGAIVYCLLAGFGRKKRTEPRARIAFARSLQPCLVQGPPPLPAWALHPRRVADPVSVDPIYDEAAPEPAPLAPKSGFLSGLRKAAAGLAGAFSYAPAVPGSPAGPAARPVTTKDIGAEQHRLSRVLDSFREEA